MGYAYLQPLVILEVGQERFFVRYTVMQRNLEQSKILSSDTILALIQKLQDKDSGVRYEAAEILGKQKVLPS